MNRNDFYKSLESYEKIRDLDYIETPKPLPKNMNSSNLNIDSMMESFSGMFKNTNTNTNTNTNKNKNKKNNKKIENSSILDSDKVGFWSLNESEFAKIIYSRYNEWLESLSLDDMENIAYDLQI